MDKIRAAITAVGHYVPETVMTNADMEKIVETNDEWIKTRTGISERRILTNGEPMSFMAVKAIEMLLQRRGIKADELDLILVGTVTPDMLYPSTACVIQEKIGAKNAWG
ncbi:MAG TPA: 3-oxoacyl-ACP synthase, partial [Ignavibacteria bacterium]|nr:3-oxoacyl-ACP synthase [Ignavibacteria bacterium]